MRASLQHTRLLSMQHIGSQVGISLQILNSSSFPEKSKEKDLLQARDIDGQVGLVSTGQNLFHSLAVSVRSVNEKIGKEVPQLDQ